MQSLMHGEKTCAVVDLSGLNAARPTRDRKPFVSLIPHL